MLTKIFEFLGKAKLILASSLEVHSSRLGSFIAPASAELVGWQAGGGMVTRWVKR